MAAITNLILLLQPNFFDNESILDNTPADSIKHIHDIRMVWPSEAPADENID